MIKLADINRLAANEISLAYDVTSITKNLNLSVADGKITTIIGPNACGKSTVLRALARLLKPSSGQVILDGHDIAHWPTKGVARKLGLLPQTPIAPQGIKVSDLVARGRTPHQTVFQQWSVEDEDAVLDALEATNTLDLVDWRMEELSGGQRQRVWIAMALAQQTDILLLDEPTTFLDLPHQIEILNLVRRLNKDHQRTVVMVLHDLNLASRYTDIIVGMRDGQILAQGPVDQVITAENMHQIFDLDCKIIADPVTKTPLIIPAAPNWRKL